MKRGVEVMPWRRQLAPRLSPLLRAAAGGLSPKEADRLTEIRVRIGRPVQWVLADGNKWSGEPVSADEMEALLASLCAHSRYAYEAQMTDGYIPLPGGHRAGVCGRVVYEKGVIARMSAVTSVCIRIARSIPAASTAIRRFLFIGGRPARVLVLGPPGCGKTTVLRDAAEYLAADCGLRVAAADEREELFFEAAADVDVLRGAKKADAVTMLVRTMSPQVIVLDELGGEEEAQALLSAVSSGVGILASAHADSFADLKRRPVFSMLYERRAFDFYVFLAPMGRVWCAMDTEGREAADQDGK